MERLIEEFLARKNIFAVVGVSRDPEKYGHRIYRDLKAAGYKVYPVNPNAERIGNDVCYRSLSELPEKPDVVDVVVPPGITESVVKECRKLGIMRVWMQPGSESKKAINFCKKNDIKVLHNICVIVERGKYGQGDRKNKKRKNEKFY